MKPRTDFIPNIKGGEYDKWKNNKEHEEADNDLNPYRL
jgi:hypothetical protein